MAAATIADTAVPDEFTAPFRRATRVLVITVEEQIRDLLGIPDTHAVAALVPLGKPAWQLSNLRRRPVEDFTTRDRFDGPSFRRQA